MGINMKKFIPIITAFILVLSGLGTTALTTNISKTTALNIKNESTSVLFSSQPSQLQKDNFVELEIDGATTQLLEPNKPVLPIYVKTYEIPFGSTNIQVVCNPQDSNTMILEKEIIPARIAPLSEMSEDMAYVKDASVYDSAAFYPDSWYGYDLGAGRNDNGQQVTFVKVVCYPVRYSPLKNIVEYTEGFDISLTYDAPTTEPKTLTDSYDMVVIAPSKFASALQPLIDFKNSKGLATMFKSMESILAEYTGYDQPEQVKYFIKDAYDTLGISYALLVGGVKSFIYTKDKDTISAGWKGWWVPVRYVSIPQDDDEGCLCDLYYGCLYNATGGFDSWDSNGDGVYAAWGRFPYPKDNFDMYPEVYVSRLPCTTKSEVKVVVNKIIAYESTPQNAKPWYKNFVGIGGITFDYYQGKPDGEYLCDLAAQYMKNAIPDLNLVAVYSTNRDNSGFIPDANGISKAINQGAGFVDFQGHGFPLGWNTHWFDSHEWVGGILFYDFYKISNGDMNPMVIVGGCHNGMFNISFIPGLLDTDGDSYFVYGWPTPICFSWGLVVKPRGGAIASTGCTGYGMGHAGNPVSLSGELESNFFWQIGIKGSISPAEAHSKAIQKFLAEETIGQTEAFIITNWALFGDPSLRFGGYSS